jgi:hypothetical protein
VKEYPSLLSADDLLARSGDHLGRPFVAFDKLDGSNIRAEWDRKKGWHRFGTGEGVVLKGGEGHGRWMAKVKTDAYLQRLRAFFKDGWRLYWE